MKMGSAGKRCGALLFVLIAVWSYSAFAATVAPDAFEPDDTPAQAKPITPGVTQIHSLDNTAPQHTTPNPSDIDYVKFTVTQASDILIQTDDLLGISPDTRLTLYDSTGTNQLATNDDIDEATLNFLSRVTYRVPAGTYYASVVQFSYPSSFSSPVSAYNLTLLVAPAGQPLPPAIISRTNVSAVAGAFFSYTLQTLSAPTVSASTFSLDPTTPLPAGLSLDPNSGVISGSPLPSTISTQPVKVNVTATNAGGSSTVALSITVSAFGIVTTIAGDGTEQSSGDGQQAILSKLTAPIALALDSNNNLFLAEDGIGVGANNVTGSRVRRIDATSGVISTIVGGGTPNPLGDGGLASAAALTGPTRIAFDSQGNLYFTDFEFFSQDRVRKISSSTGIITTVAGSGTKGFGGDGQPATAAVLNTPTGVAVDGSGNVYIADTGNNRIRMINTSGIITTVVGTGVATGTYATTAGDGMSALSATLNGPRDVAVDSSGNLFIADTGNHVIRKVSGGIITRLAGTGGTSGNTGDGATATSATLLSPAGVTVDNATGNVYISDTGNGRVRVVTGVNIVATNATGLSSPQELAFKSGSLYIADPNTRTIRKLTGIPGVLSTFAGIINTSNGPPLDGTAATSATFGFPNGVAADGSGNIYVCDTGFFEPEAIYKIDTSLKVFTVAGNGLPGDGGLAVQADLANPSAVAIDSAGNIFIADTESLTTDPAHGKTHDRIRKIDAITKIITTIAGNGQELFAGDGGPARAASFREAQGLAIDSKNNLYISDTSNNAIRVVNLTTGVISRFAGSAPGASGAAGTAGTPGAANGDNGAALSGLLNAPRGICVDTAGNLLIADTGDNTIRKVNVTTGVITTIAGTGTAGFAGDGGLAKMALLNGPTWVAVDAQNNVYICDMGNSVIRRVDAATNNISTFAGNGKALFSGDGGAALLAGIGSPSCAIIDPNGFLYIAEQSDNRIRKAGAAAPPKITNTPLPLTTSVAAGAALNYQVTATGFPAPTISANGIQAAGLSILPFGLLTGKPSSVGAFDVTLIASNGIGTPDSQNLRILVAGSATPITFVVNSGSGAYSPPSVTPNPVVLALDKATQLNLAKVTGLAPAVTADATDHVAYTWNFGDPAPNPAAAPTLNPTPTVGETADHAYQGVSTSTTTPGVYPVTVTVTDGISPDITSDIAYVCVNKSDVTQNILIMKAQFKFAFASTSGAKKTGKGSTGKDSISISGIVPVRGGVAQGNVELYLGTLQTALTSKSKTASIKFSKSSSKSTVQTALTPLKFSISLKGTLSSMDSKGVGKLGFVPKVTTAQLINVPVVLSVNGDSFMQQIQIIYKSTDKGGSGVQLVSGGGIGTRN